MEQIQNGNERKKIMVELNTRWNNLVEEFDDRIGMHNDAVNAFGSEKKKAELSAADEDLRKSFDHFVTEADHLCEKYEKAVKEYGEPVPEKDSPVKADFLTMIGLNLHIYSEMVEDALSGFKI